MITAEGDDSKLLLLFKTRLHATADEMAAKPNETYIQQYGYQISYRARARRVLDVVEKQEAYISLAYSFKDESE
jgi:hypothetical protein